MIVMVEHEAEGMGRGVLSKKVKCSDVFGSLAERRKVQLRPRGKVLQEEHHHRLGLDLSFVKWHPMSSEEQQSMLWACFLCSALEK